VGVWESQRDFQGLRAKQWDKTGTKEVKTKKWVAVLPINRARPVSPRMNFTRSTKPASARTSLERITTQRSLSPGTRCVAVCSLCPPLKKPCPCGPSKTTTPSPAKRSLAARSLEALVEVRELGCRDEVQLRLVTPRVRSVLLSAIAAHESAATNIRQASLDGGVHRSSNAPPCCAHQFGWRCPGSLQSIGHIGREIRRPSGVCAVMPSRVKVAIRQSRPYPRRPCDVLPCVR